MSTAQARGSTDVSELNDGSLPRGELHVCRQPGWVAAQGASHNPTDHLIRTTIRSVKVDFQGDSAVGRAGRWVAGSF